MTNGGGSGGTHERVGDGGPLRDGGARWQHNPQVCKFVKL